jgi:hypothetical protein
LKELAAQTMQPMTDVLERAVEAYQRKVFLDQVNAGYRELRGDPVAWAEHLAERDQWDAAVADGLGEAERWPANGGSASMKSKKKKKHG